ncbi:F-box/WD repeat-containing protein 9 isoform X1 [Bufo gargarizans]|uniref:F-box/WD repeat-containing protein 9 isoform X1 n=1 Tax=Bufo gargarizans TaxID=30331 RepID=UPI001CF5AE56|nr:F-box/WD repeat-containing protein 9 isoform X1 [Bufo gargarizans]
MVCCLPLSVTGSCDSCLASGQDHPPPPPPPPNQPSPSSAPLEPAEPSWASAIARAAADLAQVSRVATAFMERMAASDPPLAVPVVSTAPPPGAPHRGHSTVKRQRTQQHPSSDDSASPPRLEACSASAPRRDYRSEGVRSGSDEDTEPEPSPKLSTMVADLVTVVRDTFDIQGEPPSASSQEFPLFHSRRGGAPEAVTFPIHGAFAKVLSKAWERPNHRFSATRRMDTLYPFPADNVQQWSSPPKVDPPVARLAKNTAIPVLDGSSLQNSVDRRLDSLSKAIITLAGTGLQPAIASAWVARPLSVWLQRHHQDLAEQGASADTLNFVLQMSQAATFLCEASLDVGTLFARVSALSVTQRKEVWLKVWDADASSKCSLTNLPFAGSRIFDAKLDEIISDATGGKSTHLPQSRSKHAFRARPFGSRNQSFRRSCSRSATAPSSGGSQDSRKKPSFKPQPSWRSQAQSRPPERFFPSRVPGDPSQASALLQVVSSLLVWGVVAPVPLEEQGTGSYSNLFVVPKKEGSVHPVLDLKLLNKSLRVRRFRVASLRSVIASLLPGEFLASVDIRGAYLHVPITESHHRFLRLVIGGRHYQFVALPFGLATAPRVFTKILAPLMALLRTRGISLLLYSDDILIKAPSCHQAEDSVRITVQSLQQFGWLINFPKSSLQPSQRVTFLGIILDTTAARVFLPDCKFSRIQESVSRLLHSLCISIRECMQVLGLMVASFEAVLFAQFHTRPLQQAILPFWDMTSRGLDSQIRLPPRVRMELQWWLSPQNLASGRSFLPI